MLPAAAYTSPEVLAWEREHLMRASWVTVARSSVVARPGEQLAVELLGEPLLLVRDQDGALHVMANICRHRGHELLACGASSRRTVIQCPYHAWSYELDGRLRIAPKFGGVPNFDPLRSGLVPIRAGEWGGWVFVNLSGTAMLLEEHVGQLDAITSRYGLGDLVVAASHQYEIAANWKLVQENYQECYHCPLIHPELCKVSPADSGRNYDHEGGLWVGGRMDLAPGVDTMSLDGRSGGSVMADLNDEERRTVNYLGLFPNLLVSLHPDYVMTHRLMPLAPDRSAIECSWLFPAEAVAQPGFDPSYAVDFWDLTNRQDWAAVESVQRAMTSSHYVPGVLAKAEDAVYRFVAMIARAYEGEPLAPVLARTAGGGSEAMTQR